MPIVANTGNRQVTLTIEANSAYARGLHRSATVNIIDDTFNDPLPSALSRPSRSDDKMILD